MAEQKDEQIVFALGKSTDGVPVLVIGIPQGAAEYMKDGKTNNVDLTKVDFPLRVMIFGAENRAKCLELLNKAAKQNDINAPLVDKLHIDFGIDGGEKK